MRKSGRGLPKCVLKEEKTSPAEICAVHGMVKAAVLVGDEEVPDLVTVSYYDQKPVHFLSTICESIKWIECQKEVYCVEIEHVEMMKFFHIYILATATIMTWVGLILLTNFVITTDLTIGVDNENGGG